MLRQVKKIKYLIIAVLLLLVFSVPALAGRVIKYRCDRCDFVSNPLEAGAGVSGVEKTIVYCSICKNFYSIETKKSPTAENVINDRAVEPVGKEMFFGKERLVYPCPRCFYRAIEYKGPDCPVCLEGTLEEEMVGLWE